MARCIDAQGYSVGDTGEAIKVKVKQCRIKGIYVKLQFNVITPLVFIRTQLGQEGLSLSCRLRVLLVLGQTYLAKHKAAKVQERV